MTTLPANCRELLQGMVAIDSINGHLSDRSNPEAALTRYLENVSRGMGFTAQRLSVDDSGACNLLVRYEADPNGRWLLFESHMDTVGIEGMKIPPFEGRIEGNRMFGRGACDTKGSGAAMLWALRQYAESPDARNNAAVLFTVDEEDGKTGITSFVYRQLPKLGFRPSGAIVGEPTALRPVVAHCGVARWGIRTHGIAAHSSDPSKGRSAIRMMMRVIEELESNYIARLSVSHPLTGPARCSINIIHGGTAVNIVPDQCEIWVDRRVVPGENPEEVMPEVERVLETLRHRVPDLSYSIINPRTDLPLDPTGFEEFIATVSGTLRGFGLAAEPIGAGFGSDGSTFAADGIPVVLLGPGDISRAHSESEYIELDQLDTAVDVYHALMHASLRDLS